MGLALRWARAGRNDHHRIAGCAARTSGSDKIKKSVGECAQISGMEKQRGLRYCKYSCAHRPVRRSGRVLKQLKPAILAGSILIDATVALAATVGGRASRTLGVWQGSAAQQAAELVPKGVSVAAAFHNLSAELLNGDEALDCDVIVCSDDVWRKSGGSDSRGKASRRPCHRWRKTGERTRSRANHSSAHWLEHSATRVTAASVSPDCRRKPTSNHPVRFLERILQRKLNQPRRAHG